MLFLNFGIMIKIYLVKNEDTSEDNQTEENVNETEIENKTEIENEIENDDHATEEKQEELIMESTSNRFESVNSVTAEENAANMLLENHCAAAMNELKDLIDFLAQQTQQMIRIEKQDKIMKKLWKQSLKEIKYKLIDFQQKYVDKFVQAREFAKTAWQKLKLCSYKLQQKENQENDIQPPPTEKEENCNG